MANMDPNATTTADHHHVPVQHGTFKLRGVHCLGCAGAVERVLKEQPYITDVHLDWKSDVVHGGYDPARIGPEDIEQVITQTGCDCKPTEGLTNTPWGYIVTVDEVGQSLSKVDVRR